MQIVINISEEVIERGITNAIEIWHVNSAIKNGTPLENVFENIKAEIREESERAYTDFERYKVEYLGQDWEDVLDSLPQDDFRYGMERALEIICKHISGKEKE